MNEEFWQLYDEGGQPIPGKGAVRQEVFKGLLHGASHVWIWRTTKTGREVLVQKRADTKQTWPGLYDISAAGHIDLGETPVEAAIRETKEEIGLDINSRDLKEIYVNHDTEQAPNGLIENEFRFVYIVQLTVNNDFELQEKEVSALDWIPLDDFESQTLAGNKYVPHGNEYFRTVIEAIQSS